MTKSGPPSPICDEDYVTIQAAVMETSRGRWFLAEYARQNRTADTEMLLNAIQKLHGALIKQDEATDALRIKNELIDIAGAIANTKQEIAAMSEQDGTDDKIATATIELDAIVTTAEKATGDILNHAEQIQEIAWTLRENGIDEKSCAALDNHATEIYTACSFQDLTGQRTQKIIKILAFIDQRIDAMTDIWNPDGQLADTSNGTPSPNMIGDTRPDAHLLNGPQIETMASNQEEIDDVLADDYFEGTVAVEDDVEIFEPAPNEEAAASPDPSPQMRPENNAPRIEWSDPAPEQASANSPAEISPDENSPDENSTSDLPNISAPAGDTGTHNMEASSEISDLSDPHKMVLFS